MALCNRRGLALDLSTCTVDTSMIKLWSQTSVNLLRLENKLGMHLHFGGFSFINTSTTNDTFWCRQILAACYQLAQSISKIGFVLAERVGQGKVGGCTTLPDSAWWQLQLPVEKSWSMLGGQFVRLLAQMGVENALFTLQGLHFWHFRQLLVQRSVLWSESPDY